MKYKNILKRAGTGISKKPPWEIRSHNPKFEEICFNLVDKILVKKIKGDFLFSYFNVDRSESLYFCVYIKALDCNILIRISGHKNVHRKKSKQLNPEIDLVYESMHSSFLNNFGFCDQYLINSITRDLEKRIEMFFEQLGV